MYSTNRQVYYQNGFFYHVYHRGLCFILKLRWPKNEKSLYDTISVNYNEKIKRKINE